jgi:hypothetical protein
LSVALVTQTSLDSKLLYEQAGSAYLELLEETNRSPRIVAVIERVCSLHPNYDADCVGVLLKSDDFDTYLQDRRKLHQKQRAAVKLLAAELGGKLGARALEEMQRRLETSAYDIKDKDLIEYAKFGLSANSALAEDVAETQGDVKITVNLKDVLINLPRERRMAVGAAYARHLGSVGGEVIDAESSDSE